MWKKTLRQNFTDWKKLADFLQLDSQQQQTILHQPNFPLNLPLRLAEKVKKQTLDDPILKQFLPTIKELEISEGFVKQPVEDQAFRREPRLLQKYEGRVLLICTSACAMHCRFCFRQNFDYPMGPKVFEKELELIAQDPSIHEVILSGGDPLSLDNRILKQLFTSLGAIAHLKRLRIHTRFPLGIPERIDEGFLALFEEFPLQAYVALSVNHPAELDDQILNRLKALQKKGVVLLSQTVLLQGVNDDEATLTALCEKLTDNGILPYYLHQLDKVSGASHFETTQEKGIDLIQQLTKKLSGYAIPKYVKEIPGETSKSLIF